MTETRRQLALYLLFAAIVLTGVGLRLVNLDHLPMYLDETTHIFRAHAIHTDGQWFLGLTTNKALYPIALAALYPLGPEGPWLARMLSVLCGVISMAAATGLGKALGDWRVGLLAGLFYALIPMAVFHERQALVDPMMAMFTTLTTLFAVWLVRKPSIGLAVLLSLSLAGGYLTKAPALLFFGVPLAAVVLLSTDWKQAGRALAHILPAIVAGGLAIYAVYEIAANQGFVPNNNQVSGNRLRLLTLNDPSTIDAILRDYGNFQEFMTGY
ncbi:MAG: phospholipid carrier-dependent glycosyltransferase, partial [Chloroflexi bacterium]|nr:phospholipid carrier-dependent glycosyltransferase [Chloroflexota bacterium]